MNNIFFPTTIIDGFFENPKEVRNFALQQDFNIVADQFPGKRTQSLHEVNRLFFDTVIFKLLDHFFTRENLLYSAHMYFQLVDKRFDNGWIHRDKSVLTAIVYLNDLNNTNSSTGTSLYEKTDINKDPLINSSLVELRNDSFKQGKSTTKIKDQYNSNYKEVVRVEGLFNRALLFDSHLMHAAHNFIGDDDETSRLTLITFFNNISSPTFFPIQRSKIKAITIL